MTARAERLPVAAAWLGGGLAVSCGLLAAVLLVHEDGARFAWPGLLAHGFAIAFVAATACATGATRAEVQLASAMAAALPGVGTLLAVAHCCSGSSAACANAHAAHDAPGYQPTPPRPQLDQELRVASYARVLRAGSLEEKRNLLRRLASLAEPRYFAIVRRFLADPEPELRLCAYAELAAVGQRHEARIAACRAQAAAADGARAAAAETTLATALFEYATSGALDDEMAKYWRDQAEAAAQRALAASPDHRPAQRVLALAMAHGGRVEEAWRVVVAWPEDVDGELELARAEIGFRRRDQAVCTHALARLQQVGIEVPDWLRRVCGEAVLP